MKLGSWLLEITDYQREPWVPRPATKAEVGSELHTASELHCGQSKGEAGLSRSFIELQGLLWVYSSDSEGTRRWAGSEITIHRTTRNLGHSPESKKSWFYTGHDRKGNPI